MDWSDAANTPPKPNKTGVVVYDDFPLEDVLDCIDWNPFFQVCAGCHESPTLGSVLALRLAVVRGASSQVYRLRSRGRGVKYQWLFCTELHACAFAMLPRFWRRQGSSVVLPAA